MGKRVEPVGLYARDATLRLSALASWLRLDGGWVGIVSAQSRDSRDTLARKLRGAR